MKLVGFIIICILICIIMSIISGVKEEFSNSNEYEYLAPVPTGSLSQSNINSLVNIYNAPSNNGGVTGTHTLADFEANPQYANVFNNVTNAEV